MGVRYVQRGEGGYFLSCSRAWFGEGVGGGRVGRACGSEGEWC